MVGRGRCCRGGRLRRRGGGVGGGGGDGGRGTEGKGGTGPEATRTLTLKGGGTIQEELAKFEPEQKSYSYRITTVDVKVLPVTNYSSTITVAPGTSSERSTKSASGSSM